MINFLWTNALAYFVWSVSGKEKKKVYGITTSSNPFEMKTKQKRFLTISTNYTFCPSPVLWPVL
jgi:hypothetical protein